MPEPVHTVVQRLFEGVENGAVAELCVREGVELMVLFGSAAKQNNDAVEPADVDLAVRYTPGTEGDPLSLLQRLYELTGYEGFDLLDLGRAGPLAKDRALTGGRLLFQARAGLFANAQIAATMERMETAGFRRAELELLGR